MTVDLKTYIERSMISEDAGFMLGLFLGIRKLGDKGDIPFLLSCIDYYSLIIYEAAEYYSKRDETIRTKLQTNYSDVVKQSRQRMKLFDDKVLGIEGIGNMFINILTPEHQRELSKDHIVPLPKWMWTDIGIYIDSQSGLTVGTTHLASFNSGITRPQDFFSPQVSTGLGEHLGSFLALFARNPREINVGAVSITSTDTRYNKIYSKVNYGSTDELINAGLSVIDMRMNFLGTLLSRGEQTPTIFKWKFLTIYHAISSLDTFSRSEHFDSLDTKHKTAITNVLETEIASLMMSEEAIPLRNTLTHFGIDTRLDETKLHRDSSLLFGLVEASFSDWQYQELVDFINQQLKDNLLDIFHISS